MLSQTLRALLALTVVHASQDISVTGPDANNEEVVRAIQVLQTVGVSGLCHPASSIFSPELPLCADVLEENYIPASERRLLEGAAKNELSYIENAIGAFVCVFIAAIAAGLTMGLVSLDPLMLLIKMRAGATEAERKQAANLLPIVKQHHRLLVTLLLLNSMANEALPLFLEALVPVYVAVILSVTLVLFFGEIIPSAVFTGPDQIKIASSLTPLVRLVMILLFPLAYPIAKFLDVLLHDDDGSSSSYNRGELSALVRILYEERMANKKRIKNERKKVISKMAGYSDHVGGIDFTAPPDFELSMSVRAYKREMEHAERCVLPEENPSGDGQEERMPSIHIDEVSMIEGALKMKTTVALDVFTPLRKIFAVPSDMVLNEKNVVNIYSSGFSRIPVYERNNAKEKNKSAITGIMMTKQLIVVNPSDNRPISTLPLYCPMCVPPKMDLVNLVNMFQEGAKAKKGGHLALVCARPHVGNMALEEGVPLPDSAGLMGIITFEDVLEALLQEQIYDEMDKPEVRSARLAGWAFRKWKLYTKKKKLRRQEALLAGQPQLRYVVSEAQARARAGNINTTGDSSMAPNDRTALLGNEDGGEFTERPSMFSAFRT